MRISIVTPCRNAAALVGDTVGSVRGQTFLDVPGNFVEYIVVDGASDDETINAVEAAWVPHRRASLQCISEPDEGMYDALVKGLQLATGDVVAYLNAGDYYSPHCLSVVQSVWERYPVRWLTGMRVAYNDTGALISAKVPWRYDRQLIKAGFYGIRGWGRFIQQESTFWCRSLLDEVDMQRLSELRLAGDLFLWTCFAGTSRLDVVAAHLGGFRFHGNHLSDAMASYRSEARNFLIEPGVSGYFRAPASEVMSWMPAPARKRLPIRTGLIYWDTSAQDWRRQ